jgi:hypothetical protein
MRTRWCSTWEGGAGTDGGIGALAHAARGDEDAGEWSDPFSACPTRSTSPANVERERLSWRLACSSSSRPPTSCSTSEMSGFSVELEEVPPATLLLLSAGSDGTCNGRDAELTPPPLSLGALTADQRMPASLSRLLPSPLRLGRGTVLPVQSETGAAVTLLLHTRLR